MKPGEIPARVRLKVIRSAALFIWVVLPLLPSVTRGQQPAEPKRVLVLYWYNKDYPGNIRFDRSFQASLQSGSSGTVEYYPEYLESNRFPGDDISLSLHNYLQQKYANHTIDVVVANSDTALSFLLKYREDLFPRTPIVFLSTRRPTAEELAAGPGLTGILFANTERKTLDLALSLHPGTEQAFIISGTLEHDKRFEKLAREELQGYGGSVPITYLTDFTPDELTAKMKSLPERSIVLYVWQQSQNEQGKVLEYADILALIAQSARVPIYGMASPSVGSGIIGGYVFTAEANGVRAAEIALRVANGTRVQDIPVERAPIVPMFDWRELRRWGISEDRLPPGSVVQFKEISFWGLYRWHIIGVISLCLIEALLIFALLAQRARRGIAEEGLRLSEERFSKAFRASPDALAIIRRSDRIMLEVNDHWTTLSGYSRDGAIGRTTLDLGLYVNPDDRRKFFRIVEEQGFVHDFETDFRSNPGDLLRVILSAEPITINNEPCLITIIRDITERKRAEEALRKSEEALRDSYNRIEDLAGRLLVAQEEERKHIARELHDDLNQQVAALAIGLGILERQLPESSGAARSQLMKLEDRTTQLSERIRSLSRELHSSTLEHVGLAEALKLHCSEFLEQQGIAISFKMDGAVEPLAPDVALCLYRVAQESLRNIAKHSGAKRAELSLVMNEESIELRVSDQGRGFDLKEPSRGEGLGLVSMEERVRLLGGSLQVASQPGAGTELKVRIHVRSRQ